METECGATQERARLRPFEEHNLESGGKRGVRIQTRRRCFAFPDALEREVSTGTSTIMTLLASEADGGFRRGMLGPT